MPGAEQLVVSANGQKQEITAVGYKRRVVYAPLKKRDLRIGNHLYLQLAKPLAPADQVEVRNPDGKLWPSTTRFAARFDPLRWSPAIHVNQTGYEPTFPKTAMIGFYLGSLGELDCIGAGNQPLFALVDAATGREVYHGHLAARADKGFPFSCYQRVWEADFSDFRQTGQSVPGLGRSYPFCIAEGVAAAFARTYALGMYHQRCGTDNSLPFTRDTHAACHTAPAQVPTPEGSFQFTWETIASKSADFAENPRHTAPQLKSEATQLYPFIKTGKIDVSGGHHDAGDYSKYTINSAALIHQLVFAVDNFPGVAALDNLGIPESGDGKSDLLQEARWEADFLCKIQDEDGGFYFLVYPREREYESDVTPDHGDPQVVWPKTTSVTAAATAALAQCASSPTFRKQFPEAAARYLQQAKKGWDFLDRAITQHGKDGAYQKITHYGNEFMHDDELAWAACELYLATGDSKYHQKALEWLNPSVETRKWGWWRLYESYGCAMRSYAFGARSRRVKAALLDASLLARCENEIIAAGEDQLHRAEDCAYGTSLPEETKKSRSAGWYFSGDAAFDLAVACQLDYPPLNDPRPRFRAAILSNLNYEGGCNPVNICYLTGLGWQRPREIVDQYAENDRRVLPPSGIPVGNVQDGFGWLDLYGKELGRLSFPPDGDETAPHPFYDRWGDSFNLSTEFVTVNQARSLAYLAWLMAQTSLKDQPWRCAAAHITGIPARCVAGQPFTVKLDAPGVDLSQARIVWEASEHEPVLAATFNFQAAHPGPQWIEAEAQLPDGRRVFASQDFAVQRFNW
jgi:hypothetical protein